jgi:ubiquinone/menaquinone biosynthesis C-methylase UbiE
MDHSSKVWIAYEEETRRHYQDEDVARSYHAQFAAGMSLRRLSHVLVAKAEQRTVRRLLEVVRSEVTRVADIPCGSGKLVPVFRGLSMPLVGGDVSAAMMRIARAGARSEGGQSAFVQLDITHLPFREAAFDAVVCLRLLHRVPDEVKTNALQELFRVTRRYAVVSYGVTTLWHSLRQRIRRVLGSGPTIPYPMPRRMVENWFRTLGWSLVKRVNPLPILSAEEVVLLVKGTPGEGPRHG